MKITLDSFLAVLGRSGLIPQEKLAALLQGFQAQNPPNPDGQAFADALIQQNVITAWQGEKLLQGKHKGFFLGKYRLLKLLGKGGMSSVYLAEHVLMRRRCAIKVLPAKRVNDTSYLGRFHREAQAVAALDHPNIVRAYDVDHEQDGSVEIHFLVMEYVDGLSLLDIVNRDGPLSPAAAAEYIRQASLGLEHAHRAGLIHRDIKPGNLLVDNSGVVKVMDLGLARFFAGQDQESLTIQYDEKVLGTADYLAPEQAVDSHDIDARADIYSLGCTLYFLLTGHPPFSSGTLPQRLMAHQTKEPTPVEAERKDVPASLLELLKRMMAKQPGERFQTAAEVSDACMNWLQEHGGAAWESMRTRLAESGIDLGGASGRVGSGSANISAKRSAQLAEVGKAASAISKTAAAPPTVAVTPKKPAPAPTPKPQPAPDDALGAFLSNLSVDGPPAKPASAAPAPVVPVLETPAVTTRPKKPAAKPATGTKSVPVIAPPVTAPPATAPAAAVPQTPVAAPVVAEPREVVAEALLAEPVEAEPAGDLPAPSNVPPPSGMPRSSAARSRRKSGIPKQYLIYGGAGLGLLLAVVIGVIAFQGDGTPPPAAAGSPAVAGGTAPAAPAGPTGAGTPAVPATPAGPRRPTPDSPSELIVGPDGHFATINEALAYARDNAPLTDIDEQRLIRVKGGQTYAERLDIANWGLGALHIRSEGDVPATLKPTGSGPVIRIEASRKVKIEGLTIDAAGQPDAVFLSGGLSGVELLRLRLQNFTRFGISGERTNGVRSGQLQLRDLMFSSPQATATGIHLERPNDGVFSGGTQFITVWNSVFAGPMLTGIEIIGPQSQINIQKCRFHNLKHGIRLGWSGIDLDAFLIESNTFYKVATGLSLDQPPKSAAGVAIRKNLFAETSGEAAFDAAPEGAALEPLAKATAADFNATDRPADAVAAAPWNLFANQGQTGVAPDFAATDPGNDFLKPRNAALRVAAIPSGDKFIGAVPP